MPEQRVLMRFFAIVFFSMGIYANVVSLENQFFIGLHEAALEPGAWTGILLRHWRTAGGRSD
jgi:hypothetical protein